MRKEYLRALPRNTNRPLLNLAFREMRKAGILAQQNFMCCSSCAIDKLDPMADALISEGKNVTGVVFYHQQDAEYFQGTRNELCIRFFAPSGEDADALTLGHTVVKILKEAGIPTRWEGTTDKTILVDLDTVPEPVVAAGSGV